MFLPTDTGPILMTGCSSGLGRACALTFQRAGFRTVATARNLAAIEDLRAAGCRTLQLDVADEASRRAALRPRGRGLLERSLAGCGDVASVSLTFARFIARLTTSAPSAPSKASAILRAPAPLRGPRRK